MKRIVPEIITTVTGTDILSLADAKSWLRVDTTDEDDLITALIDVAIDQVQKYTGQYLNEVTCVYHMSGFFDTYLPVGPLRSVTSVVYTPIGTDITFNAYYAESKGTAPYIHFNSPPAIDTENVLPVKITAEIGYPQVGGIPAPPAKLLHAVRLLLSQYYDVRENFVVGTTVSSEIPNGIKSLMSEYRNIHFT